MQANLRRWMAGLLVLFGVIFWSLWVTVIQVIIKHKKKPARR